MATFAERKNGRWQAKIRKNGHKLSKTFKRKSDARRWATQIEASIDNSVFESSHEAENICIHTLLDRYFDEVFADKKSVRNLRYKTNQLKKILGHLKLIELTVHVAREFKQYRLECVKKDTVRKELLLLKKMIRYAMTEWQIHLPKGNPFDSISLPEKGKSRDRRLEIGEESKLIEAALEYGGVMADIIAIAVQTGMRRGEIVSMKWDNFDPLSSTIYLSDTKNGDSRTVPLSPIAVETLCSQPQNSELIFNIRGDSVGQAFRRITERADIKNLRFHDLRHEATSRFFEIGLQLMEVSAITGHKDLAMLKRYTHLRPTDLAQKLVQLTVNKAKLNQ